MNRREGKEITVMATIMVGLMMFAFMPMASATVTSFTVTPSTGLAGTVDSYDVFVTTDGVTSIDITIPAGFIAVAPTTTGVEIARVDFWNSSAKAYYGHAIITAGADPNTQVDIDCEFGSETATTTGIPVDYTPGATNTFESGFPSDTSSAIIKLPTKAQDGSIKISIYCTAFQLDAVTISIGEFVQNPIWTGIYQFTADGLAEMVEISGGFPAVFRDGMWYVDTTGDHIADTVFAYGLPLDTPLVGEFGSEDIAVVRSVPGLLWWYVDTTGNHVADTIFAYGGAAGDTPIVGDINQVGADDIAILRDIIWYVDTTGNHMADLVFGYGIPGDIPLVGNINQAGADDTAVFRAGIWYVDTTGNHVADTIFAYGAAGDTPMVGDIDHDGNDDTAVFRAGIWYVDTDFDHVCIWWCGR
jgi:hypothetical protein